MKFSGLLAFTSIESAGCCVGAGTRVALLLLLEISCWILGVRVPLPRLRPRPLPQAGEVTCWLGCWGWFFCAGEGDQGDSDCEEDEGGGGVGAFE